MDRFRDTSGYVKNNYILFDKEIATYFNWGYLTALNHNNILNDDDYGELIAINYRTYIEKSKEVENEPVGDKM